EKIYEVEMTGRELKQYINSRNKAQNQGSNSMHFAVNPNQYETIMLRRKVKTSLENNYKITYSTPGASHLKERAAGLARDNKGQFSGSSGQVTEKIDQESVKSVPFKFF
ncbi:MAG: hypothetical protein MHPSP_004179, partial [Paramarteilia canceri]